MRTESPDQHTPVRVISIPEFLRAAPVGQLKTPRAADLLRLVLAAAGDDKKPLPALVDMRGISQLLPVEEAHAFANKLGELGYTGQRIAFLYSEREREHRAALVNMWAINRRVHVRAFSDYEEAMHWLEVGDWRESHPATSP